MAGVGVEGVDALPFREKFSPRGAACKFTGVKFFSDWRFCGTSCTIVVAFRAGTDSTVLLLLAPWLGRSAWATASVHCSYASWLLRFFNLLRFSRGATIVPYIALKVIENSAYLCHRSLRPWCPVDEHQGDCPGLSRLPWLGGQGGHRLCIHLICES